MARVISVKCPSCGANLELDDNIKRAKCQYCNTNIIIEKDLNDEITANILEGRKFVLKFIPRVFIVFILIFFISFSLIAFASFKAFKNSHSKFDITSFNNNFTYSAGTKTGVFVSSTLDEVISSNKKNSKHQIYVKYNDNKTNDEDEIIAIKDEIERFTNYEVKVDYDIDGYVNLITITKK